MIESKLNKKKRENIDFVIQINKFIEVNKRKDL
jgi:hypothetical protein